MSSPHVSEKERACLLGVEQSVSGKRWELRKGDERLGLALSQRLGLPDLVGQILASRGQTLETASAFLEPTLREALPDPSCLQDADKAATLIADVIEAGGKLAVFGDYDVDGATSSAVLNDFFSQVGVPCRIYIPDRLQEGYGPNAPALIRLKEEGADLVITVDCGIVSFEALEEAAAQGVRTIVVDHHASETRLPRAEAVVNPNRQDDDSDLGHLAAVGVAFLLVVAINRELRKRGYYEAKGLKEPNLLGSLDLVALGTVCDVVPLTGLNRAFVTQGLKVIAQRERPGMVALSDVSKVDEKPGAFHLGFLLGPRVNAGGRVGRADLGSRLLTSQDRQEVQRIAQELDQLNSERRALEAEVLEQAIAQCEKATEPPEGIVIAAGEGWHPGVIGIVASRLKDRFNLPALVLAIDERGIAKGSGRSVPGVDLGAAVTAARQEGLLINGGGHPMAAGITVAQEQLRDLSGFLKERLSERLKAISYRPALGFDGTIGPGGANVALLALLETLGPYGTGNPEPRLALTNVSLSNLRVVGEDHLRWLSVGEDGRRLKCIAFRCLGTPLGELLLANSGRRLHLAGKLRRDTWSGPDGLQFIVEDAAEG